MIVNNYYFYYIRFMLKLIKVKTTDNNLITILFDHDKIVDDSKDRIKKCIILDIKYEEYTNNRKKGYISVNNIHWGRIGNNEVISKGKIKINTSDRIKVCKDTYGNYLLFDNFNSAMLIHENKCTILNTFKIRLFEDMENLEELESITLELGK